MRKWMKIKRSNTKLSNTEHAKAERVAEFLKANTEAQIASVILESGKDREKFLKMFR